MPAPPYGELHPSLEKSTCTETIKFQAFSATHQAEEGRVRLRVLDKHQHVEKVALGM